MNHQDVSKPEPATEERKSIMKDNPQTSQDEEPPYKICTLNQHGFFCLVKELRKILKTEIVKDIDFQVHYCHCLMRCRILCAYAQIVEDAYERGLYLNHNTDCEIGSMYTRSGHPEFISLSDDCFDCRVISDED